MLSLFTVSDTLHREKRIIAKVRELFETFVSRDNRMLLCFGGKPVQLPMVWGAAVVFCQQTSRGPALAEPRERCPASLGAQAELQPKDEGPIHNHPACL